MFVRTFYLYQGYSEGRGGGCPPVFQGLLQPVYDLWFNWKWENYGKPENKIPPFNS